MTVNIHLSRNNFHEFQGYYYNDIITHHDVNKTLDSRTQSENWSTKMDRPEYFLLQIFTLKEGENCSA